MRIDISHLKLLPDNDSAYFSLLESAINAVDEFSITSVIPTPTSFIIKISPSSSIYIDTLVKSLNQLHTYLNIVLKYSKSSKKLGNLQFSIDILPTLAEI